MPVSSVAASRSMAAATMRCSTSASALWALLLGLDTVNSEARHRSTDAWTEQCLHARGRMPETPGVCEAAHSAAALAKGATPRSPRARVPASRAVSPGKPGHRPPTVPPMTSRLRALIVGSVTAVLATTTVLTPAPAAEPVGPPPSEARVAVSELAMLWAAPESPRPTDARAVSAPADPTGWLRGVTTAGRRGLYGRVESQALFGQPVQVLEKSGRISRVALSNQPSPKSAGGYPGWIPTAQLVAVPAPAPGAEPEAMPTQEAVVKRRTAWAHTNATLTSRAIRLSYGTRLPVAGTAEGVVEGGPPRTAEPWWISATQVALVTPGRCPPASPPAQRRSPRRARSSGCPTCGAARRGSGSTAPA